MKTHPRNFPAFTPLLFIVLATVWLARTARAQSLCAEVKIEIVQEATLERQAFEATMAIHKTARKKKNP